jgi:hypothetical protein
MPSEPAEEVLVVAEVEDVPEYKVDEDPELLC